MTDAATIDAPPIGHNNPPSPFDAHRVNIEDLYGEAKNWLDGEPIASPEQAEAVETLLDMLRDGERAADEARKVEAKPFDDGKAEVQARYNPILKKAKVAADACKSALTTWRNAIAAEKAKAAAAAQAEAAEKARIAAEAMRQATPTNIEEREKAEAAVAEAEQPAKKRRCFAV